MADETETLKGPDLSVGVGVDRIADSGVLLGHVDGKPVILVRQGEDFFALGAVCTHQGGPLAEGLVIDGGVRCPWHHACFDLRTGLPSRPPALDPVDCYQVEVAAGTATVTRKRPPEPRASLKRTRDATAAARPASIVIIGGGAAGLCAAQTLRREGYTGAVTMLSADDSAPYDRTNLSKGVLSGDMDEDANDLHPLHFYRDNEIELRLGVHVEAIRPAEREVQLANGERVAYEALLIATGAEPVKLDVPGASLPHVHYLRSAADCHRLLAQARSAKSAVIIGASFIGLEVASGLCARGMEVHVVGRETSLMANVLGKELGAFLQELHEKKGVVFHLDTTASTIHEDEVILTNEETLQADLVVVGIGVRPRLELAEAAGLAVDRGVIVDRFLETSSQGIYAAGDIALWPEPLTGERVRIEHWVVAEHQGQTAALNMLGRKTPYEAVPFFWTEQQGFGLSYVGHAKGFDDVRIEGDLAQRDCTVSYRKRGRELAAAFVHRDHAGLLKELEFERIIGANGDYSACQSS
ncbi:FAD-dependent oxidoreductase [Lysobacter sp. A03]|uniref:FAD-dependent oxidoreductase n=1 Tax=Lysobacter sp. A03 TaxID=1199154 RepID=UPI0005B6AE8D|nr:FAD-dependent oxidoreductase [Lysobacter sp. A03]KIQ96548.1 Ferredoxin reductase [Lysobacter sp. A03]